VYGAVFFAFNIIIAATFTVCTIYLMPRSGTEHQQFVSKKSLNDSEEVLVLCRILDGDVDNAEEQRRMRGESGIPCC
jgi:hypothetical protein